MKFKNKITGQVIEPHSKFLIESFKKNEKYEVIDENSEKEVKNSVETSSDNTVAETTLAEKLKNKKE